MIPHTFPEGRQKGYPLNQASDALKARCEKWISRYGGGAQHAVVGARQPRVNLHVIVPLYPALRVSVAFSGNC